MLGEASREPRGLYHTELTYARAEFKPWLYHFLALRSSAR